jgi:hypothetical protein
MADGQRIKPIKYVIMHHSVGPEFVNDEPQTVADWYNSVGRNRGYAGIAHSYHYDPRTKQETFAQAHYALHRYTKDGNKYGWRLVLLIDDPDNNVAWGAGNWPVNQTAINIETCGDYRNQEIDDKALLLIADTFKYLDKDGGLNIKGHKEVSQTGTACPSRIQEKMGKLIDMFNNRAKYEYLLTPVAPVDPKDQKIKDLEARVSQQDKEMLALHDMIKDRNTKITEYETKLNDTQQLYDKVYMDICLVTALVNESAYGKPPIGVMPTLLYDIKLDWAGDGETIGQHYRYEGAVAKIKDSTLTNASFVQLAYGILNKFITKK